MIYRVLADLVLLVHGAFVVFVVFGLLAVFAGGKLGWRWVRNPWFRVTHLGAIGVVVLQTWLGRICPLTSLESALRQRGGEATYSGDFIGHWLHELLFISAPPWAFAVCYTAFAVLVVSSWWMVRPRPFRPPADASDQASTSR